MGHTLTEGRMHREGERVKLSDLELALLGLLSIQPMTGYDIRRHYNRALSPFWVVPKTQIYPRLRHLEDQGLVTSNHVVQESKPNKRVYELTPEGREKLEKCLTQEIQWADMRHDLLMRTFLAHLLDPKYFENLLTEYHDHLRRRAEQLRLIHDKFKRSLEGKHQRSVFFQLLSLEHLIRHTEMEAEGTAVILNAVKEAEPALVGSAEATPHLLEVIKEHFA